MLRNFVIATLTLIVVAFATLPLPALANDAAIQRAVRSSLKDPGSAKFGLIKAIGSHACAEVNAKNSFGGYTGTQIAMLKKIDNIWFTLLINGDISFSQCFEIHAAKEIKESTEKAEKAKPDPEKIKSTKFEWFGPDGHRSPRTDKKTVEAETTQKADDAKNEYSNKITENPSHNLTSAGTILECAAWLSAYIGLDTKIASTTKKVDVASHPLFNEMRGLIPRGGGETAFLNFLTQSVTPQATELGRQTSRDFPDKTKDELLITALSRIKVKAETACISAGELNIRFISLSDPNTATYKSTAPRNPIVNNLTSDKEVKAEKITATLPVDDTKIKSSTISVTENPPANLISARSVLECAAWLGAYAVADARIATSIETNEWDDLGFFSKRSARKRLDTHPLMMMVKALTIKVGGEAELKVVMDQYVTPETAKLLLQVTGEYPNKKTGEHVAITMPKIKAKAEASCANAGEPDIRIVTISNLSAITN